MTACVKCGYDEATSVRGSWVATIGRDPPSLNARVFNSVGHRGRAYRQERDLWAWEFRVVRLAVNIPEATTHSRRRVTFTRYYGGRQQERDRDNLIGGMKTVVDAMVGELLLFDDAEQWAELHYRQQHCIKGSCAVLGLGVHIEELEVAR